MGATHAAYSDHVDGNPGILRWDQAGRSSKDQRRDQNSLYHAPNPGAPFYSNTYKSGRSVTADRGWKRPLDDPNSVAFEYPVGRLMARRPLVVVWAFWERRAAAAHPSGAHAEGIKAAADRCEGDVPADEGSGVTVDADDDHRLLRKLIEQGGRKYTAGNINRRKYERLVELGWLIATTPNISDVLYEVTDQGRQEAG
jgi:hypothetical protein